MGCADNLPGSNFQDRAAVSVGCCDNGGPWLTILELFPRGQIVAGIPRMGELSLP